MTFYVLTVIALYLLTFHVISLKNRVSKLEKCKKFEVG